MLTRETVDECLDAAAADLKKMDYAELERFAESRGMFDDWQSRKLELDGVAVEVFILAGKLGRIRKRISIEITLSTVGEEVPPVVVAGVCRSGVGCQPDDRPVRCAAG